MKRLEELFEVFYGTNNELNALELEENGINFISRTSKNNGISAKVKKQKNIEPVKDLPCLTVSDGGSVLETFIQTEPFYSGRDLFYLKPKLDLSMIELMFYSTAIKLNKIKYSYGRQANRTLKDIMLPERHEIPSWVYTKKIPTVSIKKPEKLTFYLSTWKEFLLTDLFDVKRGDVNSVSDLEKGDIPVVTATENNNGISFYANNKSNYKIYENCLTIATVGNAGTVFYQKNNFMATINTSVLIPKIELFHSWLFLKTMLEQHKTLFAYGRILNDSRLKRMKIKLPVIKETQEIDWDYIEEIIKKFDNIQIS